MRFWPASFPRDSIVGCSSSNCCSGLLPFRAPTTKDLAFSHGVPDYDSSVAGGEMATIGYGPDLGMLVAVDEN